MIAKSELKTMVKAMESLPYDTKLMSGIGGSFIDLQSGITHYEVQGEGDKIAVLVHGYATPYYIYDKVFESLVANGYKVIRYDLLGRGYSERLNVAYTPKLFAKQLNDLTHALIGDAPFYLFGTSMGGSIVTEFAREYPDRVKKLVLLAPAGMDNFKPPIYMTLSNVPILGELLFKLVAGKLLLTKCASELSHVGEEEKDYYMRSFADAAKYKGFIKCTLSSLRNTILKTKEDTEAYAKISELGTPILCIWGTKDRTMPYYQSERFKEVCPSAKLVAFEGSGHIFLFDEGEKTMNVVLPFLAE